MPSDFIYVAIIRKPNAFYAYIPDAEMEVFIDTENYGGCEELVRDAVHTKGISLLKDISPIMIVKSRTMRYLKTRGLNIDNFIDIVKITIE